MTNNEIPKWQLGAAYVCLRSNKQWQSRKHKAYVAENLGVGFGPELVEYNKRYQNRLLNGRHMLAEPGAFMRLEFCPFCNAPMYSPEDKDKLVHDASLCAKGKPNPPKA